MRENPQTEGKGGKQKRSSVKRLHRKENKGKRKRRKEERKRNPEQNVKKNYDLNLP